MALRPFRECKCSGCHNLTRKKYCDEHADMEEVEEAERQRYYDVHVRNPKTRRYYNSSAWKRTSVLAKVKANGLCEYCSNDDEPVIGTEADHIIPIDTEEGWKRRSDPTNVKWSCHSCHMKKTARDREIYKGKRTVR